MNADSSKFLIVQVSDIHLKEKGNLATERLGDIAKAVANVEVDLKAAIIALSGDIAYSGAQNEYDVAKT
jgi:3',5'-cyclic AMP phosphodiesterase CpdA